MAAAAAVDRPAQPLMLPDRALPNALPRARTPQPDEELASSESCAAGSVGAFETQGQEFRLRLCRQRR